MIVKENKSQESFKKLSCTLQTVLNRHQGFHHRTHHRDSFDQNLDKILEDDEENEVIVSSGIIQMLHL